MERTQLSELGAELGKNESLGDVSQHETRLERVAPSRLSSVDASNAK